MAMYRFTHSIADNQEYFVEAKTTEDALEKEKTFVSIRP